MKVCGFTIVRNALKYDYPVIESITSVLDVCDSFVVAVGNSEDETLQLIQSVHSPKIRIIETVWDDNLREGGRVLAAETNKAFNAIDPEFDWCFYMQADEVVHEKYHSAIRKAMQNHLLNPKVEGLLFKYLHFYGTYDYVGDSRRWYRNEVRIIRNDKSIRSFKDAQGFQKNGKPLRVKDTEAMVYHYGWVKPPEKQLEKQKNFNKYWHDDKWIDQNIPAVDVFDYSQFDSLRLFDGTHPSVMKPRIEHANDHVEIDPGKKRFKNIIKKLLYLIEKHTGFRPGEYKNYRKI
jgi:hypothetical protein